MALEKKTIPINFAKGLDDKSDPWQIPIGRFQSLINSILMVNGRLTKRNGFPLFSSTVPAGTSFLATFKNNLLAIGTLFSAFSTSLLSWPVQKNFTPCQLSVSPLVRSNLSQVQCDTAFLNGLVCTVYTEVSAPGSNMIDVFFRYTVADSTTKQSFIGMTALTSAVSAPRVFALGSNFVIVYVAQNVFSQNVLVYLTINASTLAVSAAQIISSLVATTAINSAQFDGVVANNTLYLAWNGPASSVKMVTLSSSLTLGTVTTPDPFHAGVGVSVCADTTGGSPVVYVAYFDNATGGYIFSTNGSGIRQFAPTQFTASTSLQNVTQGAQNGTCTILYETQNPLGYDGGLYSDFVSSVACSSSGVVGSTSVIARAVGLASKAFLYNSTIYFLAAYALTPPSIFQSPLNVDLQPTYFLLNSQGNVIARLAWGNAGGYQAYALSSVTVQGASAQLGYLFKAFVFTLGMAASVRSSTVVNKTGGGGTSTQSGTATSTGGSYALLGVNLGTFTFGTSGLTPVETAGNLHLNGGFLWAYDGIQLAEQNFFLYPEGIEASTTTTAVTPTGTTTSGTQFVTSLSSLIGIAVGQTVTGTGILANTIVTGIDTTTNIIQLSKSATASGTVTLTFTGNLIAQTYNYIATYEAPDSQGNYFRSLPSKAFQIIVGAGSSTNTINVPTLRLTYKTAFPIRIILYRWSTAQQTYYQVSPALAPTLNNTAVDYVTFYDSTPDFGSQVANVPVGILGNTILYTTGGVVEDVSPTSFTSMALYNSRLFGVDAETGLVWFSKTIIPGAPVEFSDQLTYFVPPDTSQNPSVDVPKVLVKMDTNLIIFRPYLMCYLTGQGPDNTGANSDFPLSPTLITSPVGCSNPASAISTPVGVLFQSTDKGIWRLQRNLQVDYVGYPVENFVLGNTVTSAVLVPGTTQIRFTLSTGVIIMYDYLYEQWGIFAGVTATTSIIYNNLHTILTSQGIQQESPNTYVDGLSSPVLMSFVTGWINPAGLQAYQRAYWAQLLGQYLSPHKLNVGVSYDRNPAIVQQAIITPDNYTPNFGNDTKFGSTTPFGGVAIPTEQWQVNFKQTQCQAFQLTVQELWDPSFGTTPGAGFWLSAVDLTIGIKKSYAKNIPASRRTG